MLSWELEWGSQLRALKEMKAAGIEPLALKTRPELKEHLKWYYACYRELDLDRPTEKGIPQPLSTGVIQTYFQAFELYRFHTFSGFFYRMRQIDAIWLNAYFEKKAREAPPKPQGSPPKMPKRR